MVYILNRKLITDVARFVPFAFFLFWKLNKIRYKSLVYIYILNRKLINDVAWFVPFFLFW